MAGRTFEEEAVSTVRNGICVGGPRAGQTLATMQPGKVGHPDNPNGFYVFRAAVGPQAARWFWIDTKKENDNASQPNS